MLNCEITDEGSQGYYCHKHKSYSGGNYCPFNDYIFYKEGEIITENNMKFKYEKIPMGDIKEGYYYRLEEKIQLITTARSKGPQIVFQLEDGEFVTGMQDEIIGIFKNQEIDIKHGDVNIKEWPNYKELVKKYNVPVVGGCDLRYVKTDDPDDDSDIRKHYVYTTEGPLPDYEYMTIKFNEVRNGDYVKSKGKLVEIKIILIEPKILILLESGLIIRGKPTDNICVYRPTEISLEFNDLFVQDKWLPENPEEMLKSFDRIKIDNSN